MKTVVLEVAGLGPALASAAQAIESGHAEREARISFATPELLWEVLTAKRWELLKALCGAGVMSVHEAARRVGRDVKARRHEPSGWHTPCREDYDPTPSTPLPDSAFSTFCSKQITSRSS